MRKYIFFISFLFFPFFCQAQFQRVKGLGSASVECFAFSPDKKKIYAASGNMLFSAAEEGKDFLPLAAFCDQTVRELFFFGDDFCDLYVAGERHLFRIRKGKKEKIFFCPDEAKILTAARGGDKIYVATTQGVYAAEKEKLFFTKIKGTHSLTVYGLTVFPEEVYLSAAQGVYILSHGKLKKMFFARAQEEGEGFYPQTIRRDFAYPEKMWLGTNHGLFVSYDRGLAWHKVYISGIDNLDIKAIGQNRGGGDIVYCGGSKGLFAVDLRKSRAEKIFSHPVYDLKFWDNDRMYLASKEGLFSARNPLACLRSQQKTGSGQSDVPIAKIQEAALRYNQVHPDKIKNWQRGLKIRSLLPSLSLDYDKTINYDSGADRYFTGPRDWSVSFSWNVGDFFWSSYEDDVDTRARLNTQLRLDILDEVNRLYFERLRLERKMAGLEPGSDEFDDLCLRLRELTAALDGYTGGYFSFLSCQANKKVE